MNSGAHSWMNRGVPAAGVAWDEGSLAEAEDPGVSSS